MRGLAVATGILLALIAASEVSAQGVTPGVTPPRDAALPTIGTARVRGRVVAADTGTPMRRARVMIVSPQPPVRRQTTTDADGRYEFAGLPAARYTISGTKAGYVTLQVGQRRPFEPDTPVTVADGQLLPDMNLALPRGSVIAGRVTDELGEPLAMAEVQAQRAQYGAGGRRHLVSAGPPVVLTDDLGQFRVYGLMPGEYVVTATARSISPSIGAGSSTDTVEGFPPTFYPGTSNPAEAQPVTIALGQELSIHIALAAARMVRVSGTITDSQGKPAVDAIASLRAASGAMTSSRGGRADAAGAFSLANVAPGEYVLDVLRQPRGPVAAIESAAVPITVGNADIQGLSITTGLPATVRGRVAFEGSSPRPASLWVVAQSADPDDMPPLLTGGDSRDNGAVDGDGMFEVKGVTGRMMLRVIGAPAWALKSVTIGGDEMTDVPYQFKASQTLSGVRITLTDKLSGVSGTVTDDRGRPLNDYVVVLLPDEATDRVSAIRFTRAVRPDQTGGFRLRTMPPGRYVVAALESIEQGGEWDPELQSRVRGAGRRISVTEGQALTLDLKLTPAR